MPGMYSIIVGSPSIRPCAMFKINWIPLSTSCPAFSRSPLARSATIGSAVLSRLGMPVTRPCPSWSIISIPLCKSCGPTLVARSIKILPSPSARPASPPLWKLSVSVCRYPLARSTALPSCPLTESNSAMPRFWALVCSRSILCCMVSVIVA